MKPKITHYSAFGLERRFYLKYGCPGPLQKRTFQEHIRLDLMIRFTPKGIYVPQAKVYIDPWKPVDKALITHAHADHARVGHKSYLATPATAAIMKYRLGDISVSSVAYNESLFINGVRFSFHPAGHVLGSAQIRIEYKDEICVVSGDYKLEDDGISSPFQPVKCHTFVTESTFGLPAFRWKPQENIREEIRNWWHENALEGTVSIISAYSLGKAQRIINLLSGVPCGPIFVHPAVLEIQQIYESFGCPAVDLQRLDIQNMSGIPSNALIIIPPAFRTSSALDKVKQSSDAYTSGWMAMRGARRRNAVDRGFVLSDHADWDGLNSAIKETGAEKIFVTHGFSVPFARWLNTRGYQASVVETGFGDETAETHEVNKKAL
jgi:putative mRNA 3-end processing factor